MIRKVVIHRLGLVAIALSAPLIFAACTNNADIGNPTNAAAAPGPGVDSTGPTVPGNVVPTIGGGAGNGAGVSGGGSGVGNGH